MADHKTINLLKNTGVFALANLLTKILTFVLVPVFTHYLTTEEYGIADTVTTTSSLLLPLLSLGVYEAVLRYGMKTGEDKKAVFTNSMWVITLSTILLFLLWYPLTRISAIKEYYLPFVLILVLDEYITTFSAFSKAIGRVKSSAFLGVFRSVVYLSLSILFVVAFRWKTQGYLYALVLSEALTFIGYTMINRYHRYLCFRFDSRLLRQMLSYSLPLMINGLMWWIMQSSDKYVLLATIGASANGIYSVANKVPSILTLLHTTFFQAWQLSVIEEHGATDASAYFTKIFKKYCEVAFSVVLICLLLVKPVFTIILGAGYIVAWRYSLLLSVATLFFSFSSFYGCVYSASEHTKNALFTSLVGAVTNIVLNIILIPKWGIQGAAFTTMLSYLIMWVIRYFDVKRYHPIGISIRTFVVNGVAIAAIIPMMLSDVLWLSFVAAGIGLIALAYNMISFWRGVRLDDIRGLFRRHSSAPDDAEDPS